MMMCRVGSAADFTASVWRDSECGQERGQYQQDKETIEHEYSKGEILNLVRLLREGSNMRSTGTGFSFAAFLCALCAFA